MTTPVVMSGCQSTNRPGESSSSTPATTSMPATTSSHGQRSGARLGTSGASPATTAARMSAARDRWRAIVYRLIATSTIDEHGEHDRPDPSAQRHPLPLHVGQLLEHRRARRERQTRRLRAQRSPAAGADTRPGTPAAPHARCAAAVARPRASRSPAGPITSHLASVTATSAPRLTPPRLVLKPATSIDAVHSSASSSASTPSSTATITGPIALGWVSRSSSTP